LGALRGVNQGKSGHPMAIGDQTTLEFTFGSKTVQGAGFGTNNTVAAGDTALFSAVLGPVFGAVGGVKFAYSSAGQNSNIDGGNSGQLNVRGTDTLALAPSGTGHSFSNATLDFGIVFGSNIAVSFLNSTGAVLAAFNSLDISAGGTLQYAGKFSQIRFKSSFLMNINSLTMTVKCFVAGTHIDTPKGQKNVEDLRTGDQILTIDGQVVLIEQMGKQTVYPTFQHPAKINPICIRKGALGHGLPHADLYVSIDHGIEIDQVIYTAGALINGTTIFQTARWPHDDHCYYHIACARHALILANGVAAETFVDYAGWSGLFDISDRQDPIAELPLPRVSDRRKITPALRAHLAGINVA